MTTLAEDYDYVMGGDPDRDTIDLAVLDTATGSIRAHIEATADGPGYARMLDWARKHAPGGRVWALEGTEICAAGFAGELALAGEDVVEVGVLKRARGAKNDRLDAVRAARTALAREHQSSPSVRGLREAIKALSATRQAVLVSRTKAINDLKSLIVVAPEQLRAPPARPPSGHPAGIDRKHGHRRGCHGRTPDHGADIAVDHRAHTVPDRPARGHRSRAGPSHPATSGGTGAARRTRRGTGRRSPAAHQLVPLRTGQKRSGLRLAGGVAPLEASSGQRTRHRLNRGGDRALNRALHTVAITRIRCHAETRAYEARRTL